MLGSALPLLDVFPTDAQSGADRPPNIVLILTDDQDFRSLSRMPNVGALIADRGTTFPNFVVSTPGCCPSRASILRGQYTHNHGVLRSDGPNGGESTFRALGREDSTVATWLKGAGYRTALVGKYLNGYAEDGGTARVPPGWDEWYASISLKYVDYRLIENGETVDYGNRAKDYLTDVLSAKAQGTIRRFAETGDPFFLLLAPRAPHSPATPAPRHQGAFANAKAPRSPAFDERDVADKPAYVRNAPPLGREERRAIDAFYRDRLRSLQAVDEMVEQVVGTLRETGELERTYIFFTSDNGYLLGEHRLTAKGLPYEESIRMPLLVRGPGVPAGAVERRLVSNIDLAPTFAALAGVDPPAFVDGRSLLPLLGREPPTRWRDAVLVATFGRDPDGGPSGRDRAGLKNPNFSALRAADRVYVEYDTGERELYDLRADPDQLANLAFRPGPRTQAEPDRLAAWLDDLRRCGADGPVACRAAEERSAVDDAAEPSSRDGRDGRRDGRNAAPDEPPDLPDASVDPAPDPLDGDPLDAAPGIPPPADPPRRRSAAGVSPTPDSWAGHRVPRSRQRQSGGSASLT